MVFIQFHANAACPLSLLRARNPWLGETLTLSVLINIPVRALQIDYRQFI